MRANKHPVLSAMLLISVLTCLADAQSYSVLHNFGNTPDAKNPYADLFLSGKTVYGTTEFGGSNGVGTIFKVNIDGSGYVVFKNFANGPDGASTHTGLVLSGCMLYGTTSAGGSANIGTVFTVDTNGAGFTFVKNFSSSSQGWEPEADLLLSGDILYGTTYAGGSALNGTIFMVNTDGTGFTVLKTYTNNSDGVRPKGALVLSGNTLYGTTYQGGSAGVGTIFSINTNGTGFTVLKSFTNNPDGANPQAGLLLSGSTLYGTTYGGGSKGYGTIFAINTNGSGFTVLKNFTNSPDGANPEAGLLLSGSTLYGTTYGGGANASGIGVGMVFAINTNGTGFTVLKYFGFTDGQHPMAGLISSGDALYGTAYAAGNNLPTGYGVVFKISLTPKIQPTIVAGGQISLGWTAILNSNYQFQYTTNLTQAGWINAGNPIAATNATMSVSFPAPDQQGFYRVVYQP